MTNNPMKRFIERIDEAGWKREDTGNEQWKIIPLPLADGTLPRILYLPKWLPGDWRAIHNIESKLKNAGLPPENVQTMKKANGIHHHIDDSPKPALHSEPEVMRQAPVTLETLLSRAVSLLTSITDNAAELCSVIDQIRGIAKADTEGLRAELAKFEALKGILKGL